MYRRKRLNNDLYGNFHLLGGKIATEPHAAGFELSSATVGVSMYIVIFNAWVIHSLLCSFSRFSLPPHSITVCVIALKNIRQRIYLPNSIEKLFIDSIHEINVTSKFMLWTMLCFAVFNLTLDICGSIIIVELLFFCLSAHSALFLIPPPPAVGCQTNWFWLFSSCSENRRIFIARSLSVLGIFSFLAFKFCVCRHAVLGLFYCTWRQKLRIQIRNFQNPIICFASFHRAHVWCRVWE